MYQIKVNVPNLAKGEPVLIDGLGEFENGSTSTITEDDANAFRMKHSTHNTAWNKDGRMSVVYKPGLTILQAAKETTWLEVTKPEDNGQTEDNLAPVVPVKNMDPAAKGDEK